MRQELFIVACFGALLFYSACRKDTPALPQAETQEPRKVHAQVLGEMYRVIFLRLPKDENVFMSIVDSLDQGASLEGTYNGFTHSAFYRGLESSGRPARAETLRAFGQQMAKLESAMTEPKIFTAEDAAPLAKPLSMQDLAMGGSAPQSEIAFNAPVLDGKSAKPLDYEKWFSKASVFTLKRVLSDEALRVIAEKQLNLPALQAWFAAWAADLTTHKVDLGSKLRSNPDPKAHQEWASHSDLDALRWETVVRLHRLLNDQEGLRIK